MRVAATCDRRDWRGKDVSTEEADLCLLIRSEGKRCSKIRNASRDQTAVVAPGEIHVGSKFLPALKRVLRLRRLLEVLIVIDAKHTGRKIGIKKQSTGF